MSSRTVRILIPRKRPKLPPRFAERKIRESITGSCTSSVRKDVVALILHF